MKNQPWELSERERTNPSIPEGEERYRFVFHQSPVGIFQYDMELHVTECNEQFLGILQAWGEPVDGLALHTLKDQRLLSALRTAIAGLEGLYEGPYEAASGSGHSWFLLKTVPLHDDRGHVQGGVGIIQDLTERKRVEVSLEKRTCALQALHQVTKDLGSDLKVSTVLRRIMDRAVELLDARRGGGIYLYDAAQNVLRLAEVAGINEGRTGTVLQIHEGMAGRVFQTAQPLIVNDYANWPGRATVLVPWPSSAVMGVPLFLEGRVIGVLGVFDDSHRRTFDKADVELAEMFAAQAAIAIRNAELYEQAQREIAERKRAEEAVLRAHEELELRVEARTKEWKQAELEMARLRRELAHISRVTMLGELTASLAHELNQPLTAIVSNAHAGERYLASPAPPLEELREILADVAADAQRAGEVIRGLRSLLKKDTTRFLSLDLNELTREVVTLTQTDALIRHQPITLALAPNLPPVLGDRVQLQQVLLNLVLNGMEAMEPEPPAARELRIQTLPAGSAVHVGVTDQGPGIPPEKLEMIFDAFFTTKAQGMGMGLAISRSIVEAHGGRIWAENSPERGATFWFSLPG